MAELHEAVDDPAGVWAAVDVVAEGDDEVIGGWAEFFEEDIEGVAAAVDVADGDGSHGERESAVLKRGFWLRKRSGFW